MEKELDGARGVKWMSSRSKWEEQGYAGGGRVRWSRRCKVEKELHGGGVR